MKTYLKISSDHNSISRAVFDVYTDIKKKELTKTLKFDTLIKVDCSCDRKTEYVLEQKE